MLLGDFQALVSTTLARGSSLDSRIPTRVALAAQWMERNYTFKYMETFKLLQIVQNERTVDLPTNAVIKAWKFLRLINQDGSYSLLKKVEPEDVKFTGVPTATTTLQAPAGMVNVQAFWQAGLRQIVFDSTPQQDYNGEAMWYQYTDWPVEPDSREPLLDIAADAMLYETLLIMAAVDLRDQRMVAAWKELRDEAINTLTRAEDETKFGGESISMVYNPEPGGGLASTS